MADLFNPMTRWALYTCTFCVPSLVPLALVSASTFFVGFSAMGLLMGPWKGTSECVTLLLGSVVTRESGELSANSLLLRV